MSAVYQSVAHVEDMIKKEEPLQKYYDLQEELGRGRFAVVKKCVSKENGETFAAKIIRKSRHGGRSGREQLLLEIDILNQSDHPKLVRLYDVFETRTELILILEYAPGGDLHRHCIEGDNVRTEKEICYLIRQITEAVRYLHNKNVVHLDLKPDNILLKRAGQLFPEIRLIDFGLSRRVDVAYTQCDIVGTPEYVAPEVLAFEPLELASDMCLSGISPFAGDDVMETYANIGMVEYDFDCEEFDEVSDEAIDFIEKLLLRKPKERMSAREALEHPWLKQLEDGLTQADIAAALKAQNEGPPEAIDLSPLKVEEDVVSSASDDASEVSEAFDDSTSDASECKSIDVSEVGDGRSLEVVKPGRDSSPTPASPVRKSPSSTSSSGSTSSSSSSEEGETVRVVRSKEVSGDHVGEEVAAVSEKHREQQINAELEAVVGRSSPEHGKVEIKSVDSSDKRIDVDSAEHKIIHGESSVAITGSNRVSIEHENMEAKNASAPLVHVSEEPTDEKNVSGKEPKINRSSQIANQPGSKKLSESVEASVPPRGKAPERIGTDASKGSRASGKEVVPGGIASKMASKFANFQESFEKKAQKTPVHVVGLKVNALKIGEEKTSPAESPKPCAKFNDRSPVVSPKLGSKFPQSLADNPRSGATPGLKDCGKLEINDSYCKASGKDLKTTIPDKAASPKPGRKDMDRREKLSESSATPTEVLRNSESPSPKREEGKQSDVCKLRESLDNNKAGLAQSKVKSSEHETSVSIGGVKSSKSFSVSVSGKPKVATSPDETGTSTIIQSKEEESKEISSAKTPVKSVSRENSAEGGGKDKSSPVTNGSYLRETQAKSGVGVSTTRESDSKTSGVTMKIGGAKFNVGPIVSAASLGKSEERLDAASGDVTSVSGGASGTPLKVKMRGGSLKLNLDVTRKVDDSANSPEQKLIEAEEMESFDEDGLLEKRRAATLQEGQTAGLDSSADKSKSATLRESRKASLLRREDTQRKNYRRLYVTKVRNSKVFEGELGCATETAEIKQRVENDVLKIDLVLKSTDLMLLPR